jgi:hypothetical protein
MNELQNIDLDIIQAFVVGRREVSTNHSIRICWILYAIKVRFEAFFDCVFSLSHIEFVAPGAFYAIN